MNVTSALATKHHILLKNAMFIITPQMEALVHITTSNQEKMTLGIGTYSCNWGAHICGLYESDQERDAIIFGFLSQGYTDGDRQLYCPVERTEEEFYTSINSFCPSCSGIHDPDHFTVMDAKSLYYPSGVFDPWHMDRSLEDFYVESQKKGRRNIRATAEMAWALEAIPGVEHLMAYEARLNYFIPGKPWISICMYNVNKFPGTTILNVIKTHPFTINGGIITQNPLYIQPDKWLADNATQFLSRN